MFRGVNDERESVMIRPAFEKTLPDGALKAGTASMAFAMQAKAGHQRRLSFRNDHTTHSPSSSVELRYVWMGLGGLGQAGGLGPLT